MKWRVCARGDKLRKYFFEVDASRCGAFGFQGNVLLVVPQPHDARSFKDWKQLHIFWRVPAAVSCYKRNVSPAAAVDKWADGVGSVSWQCNKRRVPACACRLNRCCQREELHRSLMEDGSRLVRFSVSRFPWHITAVFLRKNRIFIRIGCPKYTVLGI